MSQKKSKKYEPHIKKKVFSALLPLLFHLIAADGKITEEETDLVVEFIKELPKEGFTLDELNNFLDKTESILEKPPSVYIENAIKVLDKEEQLECLKILILASLIDQEFDISEADVLLEVSEGFGLDLEKVLAEVTEE